MSKVSQAVLQPPLIIFALFSFLGLLVFVLFQPKFLIPLWIPAVLFLFGLMMSIMYGFHLYTDWQFNPEGTDIIYSRKTDTPLLAVEAYNGMGRFVRGVKEKKGDIFYAFDRKNNEGIHIDPSVQSGAVPKTIHSRGLAIYHYGTGSPFPMGSKQAVAMGEILKHVRANYPILDVFDGATILEYVSRPRSELAHDCANLAETTDVNIPVPESAEQEFKEACRAKVDEDDNIPAEDKEEAAEMLFKSRYKEFVSGYRANELVQIFMRIQDESAKLPVPNRLFSYSEAFMNVATAFTAFDYQTLMQLFEMIARKENELELKWLVGICVGVGILIFLGALAYSIIGSVR